MGIMQLVPARAIALAAVGGALLIAAPHQHQVQLTSEATVRVTVSVSSGGQVTGPGIGTCTSTCSTNVPSGQEVQLTARPDAAHVFAGWTGACADTQPKCHFTATTDAFVGATFRAK
jgi:uncharacterized repeat protein (TIGR02543 family)